MSSCTLNSREAVDLLTERSDESLWYDIWLILLLSLKVAERFVTLTNLMHYLHVLSLRHVLSPRGDKSCRKVHLLHDLSPLRQQHYHLSLLFLWCVCVCECVCGCVHVSVGACMCVSVYVGSGDSSMVRAPESWLKGRGFESLQERRENFLLRGQLSVLTLISVSIPPPCYCSST